MKRYWAKIEGRYNWQIIYESRGIYYYEESDLPVRGIITEKEEILSIQTVYCPTLNDIEKMLYKLT